jgi:hypothetical protein
VSDPRIARRLGAAAFLAFLLASAGIPSANPGSHYALVRAMAEQRSFVIDAYAEFTHGIDLARREGHAYSNKSPITAVLALPFYVAGRAWASGFSWPAYPVGHDAGDPAVAFVLALPALAAALCVALTFSVARRLGGSLGGALAAALAVGFGTLLWRYATTLYSHAPSAALVAGLVLTALGDREEQVGRRRALALGVLAGLALAIEYSNALAVAALLSYALAARRVGLPRSAADAVRLGCLVLGAAVPLGFLAAYNAACFGTPLTTAYAFAASWDGGRDVVDVARLRLPGFSAPLGPGVLDLLLGRDKVEYALLRTSPVLVLAPLGWILLARRSWREALMLAVAPLAILLPMATFRAYWGGATADARYVVAALPLLGVPVAFAFDALRSRAAAAWRAAVILLLAVSVARSMRAVAVFDGHPIREFSTPLTRWSARLDLAALFPAATAFFPRPLADEEATGRFLRWEWSEDGRVWSVAAPPRAATARLMQRAFFRANARKLPRRLTLVGQGCLASVSINKVTRRRSRCPEGANDAWEPLPVGGLVWPGLNLIEVEVLGPAHLDGAVLQP